MGFSAGESERRECCGMRAEVMHVLSSFWTRLEDSAVAVAGIGASCSCHRAQGQRTIPRGGRIDGDEWEDLSFRDESE